MTEWLYLGAGFVLLVVGGDLLVRGSVDVAKRLGLSPLLIGITLVGFGTSLPELVTSVQAAMMGSPGIAVGNIVGSNISNVLLILGLSALVTPIIVPPTCLQRDGVIVALCVLLFAGIGFLGALDRPVGIAFIALLIGYMWFAYVQESRAVAAGETTLHDIGDDDGGSDADANGSFATKATPYAIAIIGLIMVLLGGSALVTGAVGVARSFGISETIIGLTIVAAGTSMPELVTSMIAAFRNHGDVAFGNVIGSTIYNCLGIGGATALISPTIIPPEIVTYDNIVMVLAVLGMLAFARFGMKLSRPEGLVLFVAYVAYIYSLIPGSHLNFVG